MVNIYKPGDKLMVRDDPTNRGPWAPWGIKIGDVVTVEDVYISMSMNKTMLIVHTDKGLRLTGVFASRFETVGGPW